MLNGIWDALKNNNNSSDKNKVILGKKVNEKPLNYLKEITSISLINCKELLNGIEDYEYTIYNLHTDSAIYSFGGMVSTDFYHAMLNRNLKYRYSLNDTKIKQERIKELQLDKLMPNFETRIMDLRIMEDPLYEPEKIDEEYREKNKEWFTVKDNSKILIRYTNGESVSIGLSYLSTELINEIYDIIHNPIEKTENVDRDEIIRPPLLKFDNPHNDEIEVLEQIRKCYYELEFEKIHNTISEQCLLIDNENNVEIKGKSNIISYYNKISKDGKTINALYQGVLMYGLNEKNEPTVFLQMGKRYKDTHNLIYEFYINVEFDENGLLEKININNIKKYNTKYIDDKNEEKIKSGGYSDF